MGRRGGIEEEVVPRTGIPFATIVAAKVDRETLWRNWPLPVLLPRALWQAWRVIGRFQPDVVLGTGGYVSAPLVLAAAGKRVPVVLQEQNYVPGRATRLLARFATVVATAYPESGTYLDGRRTVVTGTPVRPEFERPRADFPQRPRLLLTLGGSQGAHRINQALAAALPRLLAATDLIVSHQTGRRDIAAMQRIAASLGRGDRYRPFAFAEDLPARLRASDLVLSRAGASTLSEVSAVGVPMILIPGAFAGGHQVYNARPFAQSGAAVVIPDAECTGERLAAEVTALVADAPRYRRMVAAMQSLGRPAAADAVVDLLREAVRAR